MTAWLLAVELAAAAGGADDQPPAARRWPPAVSPGPGRAPRWHGFEPGWRRRAARAHQAARPSAQAHPAQQEAHEHRPRPLAPGQEQVNDEQLGVQRRQGSQPKEQPDLHRTLTTVSAMCAAICGSPRVIARNRSGVTGADAPARPGTLALT